MNAKQKTILYWCSLWFCFLCTTARAQLTHVRYLVIEDWRWKDSLHFPEATQKNAWYADLYFDQNASFYVEKAEPASEEETMQWIIKQMEGASDEGKVTINAQNMPFRLDAWEYYFYNECHGGNEAWEWVASSSMGYQENCDALKIEWAPQPAEKRNISGVDCKKATGTFRGRQYVVWYAPSIPYAYGPWKLRGLPGLVLEAYEQNRRLVFQLVGVEYLQEAQLKERVAQVKQKIKHASYYATRKDFLKKRIEEENRKRRMVKEASSPFTLQEASKVWRELDYWK
ncbi:GLPGLI family protein [Thermonema lapsum]|uniref:GLPGLI family protein n=1 Tax=Thermonema lapsum TaxID=28195 RepID=A0A846MQZ9_9BACT|nr:GLPGLI family protein [Thermonema lapsum]NIK73885.1 GLPGLI family protein [Thermonema lapsum]